jgi:hypothetical protein
MQDAKTRLGGADVEGAQAERNRAESTSMPSGSAIIERIQRLKPKSVTPADWFTRAACITIWHEQPQTRDDASPA